MSWSGDNGDWRAQFERNNPNFHRDFDQARQQVEADFQQASSTAAVVVGVIIGLLVLTGIIVIGTTIYCWKKKRITPGVVIRPPPGQGGQPGSIA